MKEPTDIQSRLAWLAYKIKMKRKKIEPKNLQIYNLEKSVSGSTLAYRICWHWSQSKLGLNFDIVHY